MQRQKVMSLILVVMLASMLILAGCGNKQTETAAQASVRGVTDNEVVIGSFVPMSGPAAAYAAVAKGLDAYIKYVNDNGGVNGRKIRLIIEDDQYQPAQTVAKVRKLVEQDHVFAIVAGAGTAPNLAVKDYLVQNQVPSVAFLSGAGTFINPPNKYYFGVMSNYGVENGLEVKYAVEKLGLKKIALARQNDEAGQEAGRGATDQLAKYNLKPVVDVTFEPNNVDFSAQALKLKESNAEAVIIHATPKPTASLANEMAQIGYKPQILTSSVAVDKITFDLAGQNWDGAISTQYLPLITSNDPKVVEFVQSYKKYNSNEEPGSLAMLGWSGGQVFVEGLRRAGKSFTVDSFIAAMENIKNWDKGLIPPITYTATDRIGQNSSFFVKADSKTKQFNKITDYVSLDQK